MESGTNKNNGVGPAVAQKAKISIITVVYNGVKYIEESIQSVLNQNYPNLEYIIIDGGSTDGTQEIIKKYESNLAYWVSEKDSGIYNAMNKGWKKSSGELIAILNADDYYLEGALINVATFFDKTKADVIYGNMTKLREIGGKQYFREEFPNLHKMEESMGVFHPSTFVKRSVYQKLNGYNEAYKLSADYDFFLRAYKQNFSFQYLNVNTTVFRVGGVSNTNCLSYKEGYKILVENESEFAPQMKKAIYRCYIKKTVKRFIRFLLNTFGLRSFLERRIEKNWIIKED